MLRLTILLKIQFAGFERITDHESLIMAIAY
jgi:hypothetical protein